MKSIHRNTTLLALIAGVLLLARPSGADPQPIAPEQFEKLFRMVRVQPEEQRFWRLPWKLDIMEARREAAAAGKPILIWAGAGGAPIGVC